MRGLAGLVEEGCYFGTGVGEFVLCLLTGLGGESAGLFAVICLVLCYREVVRLGPGVCACWGSCGADRVRTRVPLVVIGVYNFFLRSKHFTGL